MGLKFKAKGTLEFTPKAQKKLKKGQFTTYAQAKTALERKYWKEVARAKVVARELALKNGTVTSRQVVSYMIAEGSFTPNDDSNENWVGSVWGEKIHKLRVWEWTREWDFGKSTKTQGGKCSSKIWKLAKLPWD